MNTNERELVLKDEVYAIGLIINFKIRSIFTGIAPRTQEVWRNYFDCSPGAKEKFLTK